MGNETGQFYSFKKRTLVIFKSTSRKTWSPGFWRKQSHINVIPLTSPCVFSASTLRVLCLRLSYVAFPSSDPQLTRIPVLSANPFQIGHIPWIHRTSPRTNRLCGGTIRMDKRGHQQDVQNRQFHSWSLPNARIQCTLVFSSISTVHCSPVLRTI